MKRIVKTVTLIFAVAVLVVLSGGTSASAKKIKIKKPAITVKKKATTSVKLQLSSKNKKLTGYKIYRMKVDDSGIFTINLGWKKLKTIKVRSGKKKMSYTVKKLKSGIKYKFKVVAYRKYKGKTYTAAKTKSVTTKKESANNKNIGNKNDTKKPTDNNTKNPADDVGYQKKMLDKVNEYRRAAGVPELKLNQDLCNIAMRRAKAAATGKISSAHAYRNEYVKSYYKGKGYDYYYTCLENAAFGYGYMSPAYPNWTQNQNANYTWQEVLNNWVESEGHFATMKKENWTDFGCAYYEGAWYQVFGDMSYVSYFWQDCEDEWWYKIEERVMH